MTDQETTNTPTQEPERLLGPSQINARLQDKAAAFEISRAAFFSNPEVKETLKQLGIPEDIMDFTLRKATNKAIKAEHDRLWFGLAMGRPVSPEEYEAHKAEVAEIRRNTVLTKPTPQESEEEREEREANLEVALYDQVASEEERLQAIVDSAKGKEHPFFDPSHPDHEREVVRVEAAKAKLTAVTGAFSRGASLQDLLDIMTDEGR